ncbi:glycosyltransferase family 2 protein [Streptomyces nondiastaticus]|uniref:glycosyltransferase family 2 protein n=1 Tax=Streptomyces nondiastaticus TaxID=3154512 RepID=UPI003419D2CD
MRVRNGGPGLVAVLDGLARWCDDIYVVDDRSTDGTAEVLRSHPRVTNVVHARPDLPGDPWLVPESAGLELLYRMADFCRPDWVVMADDDQAFEVEGDLRARLAALPGEVAGVRCALVSSWNDPQFPRMVPLMGAATSMRCAIWRYRPGLKAGSKPLHNHHWPLDLTDHGRLEDLDGIRVVHSGWDTLDKRIARVRLYQRLDPDNVHNFGAAYDRALLFGYRLDELDRLKADYARRAAAETTGTAPV